MEMKRDDLVKMIADVAGTQVAKQVEEAMAKAMEPYLRQQTDWMSRITGDKGNGHGDATPLEVGLGLGQCLRAMAFGKLMGSGMAGSIEYAKKNAHPDVVRAFEQQRDKAMSVGDATAGGFIVPPQYAAEIITLLRPASIVRSLGPVVLPMPTGTVRVSKVTEGTAASYIGENTNAPVTQVKFGQITLTFKKLAALVPISNDLIRYSSPGADGLVRDDLVRALAQRENQAFLRDPGTEFTPRGIRYWVDQGTNVLTSAGTSLANMITDMGAMVLALQNANVPMTRGAWMMSPRNANSLRTIQNANGFFVFREEMMRGALWGFPYAVTTQMPGSGATGEMYLADMADAVIGESQNMIIDTSMEAAYYDGANVQAAFSLDQTVMRAIAEHDFALRRTQSAVVMSGMSW